MNQIPLTDTNVELCAMALHKATYGKAAIPWEEMKKDYMAHFDWNIKAKRYLEAWNHLIALHDLNADLVRDPEEIQEVDNDL